jgi:hypothetical protein
MAELLDRWNSDTLKKYLSMLGGGGSITRKGDRIDFICQKLLDKASLHALWQQMDDTARRAVSTAYHNGGGFDASAFVAQYGQLPPRPRKENAYMYGYGYHHREPILFDLFVINGLIPVDLMPLLSDLVLPVDRFQLEGVAEPPAEVERWEYDIPVRQVETEMIGHTDMLTYLQMVEQGQVRFGASTNRLTAGSVRKVLANLMDGDFLELPDKVTGRYVIRPMGLDVFAQESGLMTRTGKLTKAGRSYLRTQDPEIILAAFERWTENGKFDELSRISHLKGLKSRGTRLTPPASRREKVIEALSWCPVNVWIDILDFYRAIIIWDFDFAVETTAYTNLYVGPSRYYGELFGDDYWNIVNGLYINAIIWEYLGTIGAVDLFYATADNSLIDTSYDYMDEPISLHDPLLYFRINDWGAYLLGQADSYEPPKPKRKELFTVDAERRVHLLADLTPNERLQLEAITEPADGQAYQLSTIKLLTAVEGGYDFDQIVDFLQASHQGELSPSVADWLVQLKTNIGAFKEAGTAVLVQVRQPDLMEIIQQDNTLARLCRKVDDGLILVPSAKINRFRSRLKGMGYLVT